MNINHLLTLVMHAHTWMHWMKVAAVMSLLHYLKPVDGLPDPRGELSAWISSWVIAESNKKVQQAINDANANTNVQVC